MSLSFIETQSFESIITVSTTSLFKMQIYLHENFLKLFQQGPGIEFINSFTQNTFSSLVWWCMPVIPATREAEAGERLNLGGGVCSEPRLRPCTPAWATRLTQPQKKKKKVWLR